MSIVYVAIVNAARAAEENREKPLEMIIDEVNYQLDLPLPGEQAAGGGNDDDFLGDYTELMSMGG